MSSNDKLWPVPRWLSSMVYRPSSLIVFVLALAIRLFRLDSQSLWLDEGGTWAEVTGRTGKGWLVLLGELFSPDAGYPLYHLLLKGWLALAGDSEWALRFPSALCGALAVVLLWVVGQRAVASSDGPMGWLNIPGAYGQQRHANAPQHTTRYTPYTIIPALWPAILLVSPYALWHAQDAKAYSMLFLALAVVLWVVCVLVEHPANGVIPSLQRDWLLFFVATGIALCVHRLALLTIAGALLGLALAYPRFSRWIRGGAVMLALGAGLAGLSGTMRVAAAERALSERGSLAPLEGLWLTLVRFIGDRAPGDLNGFLGLPLAVWLLPGILLTFVGLWMLGRAAWQRDPYAIMVLCMALTPLLLVLGLLAFAPIYEPRYAMVAFPGWLLVLGSALKHPQPRSMGDQLVVPTNAALYSGNAGAISDRLSSILATLLLLTMVASLLQPGKGLWSGAPLKEQWREAVQYLAQRSHPDDLILIHPFYVADMYAYYAPRVTPDPLPQPVTFPVFVQGDTCGETESARIRDCWARRYAPFFNQAARGRKRALLLIAPDHARTVDPPKTLAELIDETPASQPLPTSADRYGWVGLRFQYPQKTWPCGGTGDALIGVEVMCQSFPETYNAGLPGDIPQPVVPTAVVFAGELRLRGYTLAPHGNTFRPGGTIPITLFWQADVPPSHDYRIFLHLCQDCSVPPVANDDGPPLAGYPPAGLTSTWLPGDPLHDERTLVLPTNLPPGHYTILMGITHAGERVPLTGGTQLEANRLVLAEVEVGR